VFYLAQSYRDAGQLERSREVYQRRAQMGGWDEEVWFSLYQIAVLSERLGAPPAEIASAYLSAYQFRPTRAEPLVRLAAFHRKRGEFSLALLYARQATRIPQPPDILFVESGVYRWDALDELSVAAWYAGAREEGAAAIRTLLAIPSLPQQLLQRATENAKFYA
jgi:hypothetical protein